MGNRYVEVMSDRLIVGRSDQSCLAIVRPNTRGRLVEFDGIGFDVVWDSVVVKIPDGRGLGIQNDVRLCTSSLDGIDDLGYDLIDRLHDDLDDSGPVAETIRCLDDEQDDPPTVSLREASDMVDLTVAEVELLIATADFPSPEGYIRGRPYWETATVERWIEDQDQEDDAAEGLGDEECPDDEQSCPCPVGRIASALERLGHTGELVFDTLARIADVAEQAFLGEDEPEEEDEDAPEATAEAKAVTDGVLGLVDVASLVGVTAEELEKAIANGKFPAPDYLKGNPYWAETDVDAWAQAGGTIPVSGPALKPNTILVPAPGQRVKGSYSGTLATVERLVFDASGVFVQNLELHVITDSHEHQKWCSESALVVGENPRMVEITLP